MAYIPGTRRIVSLDEGEPAPFDGSLISPALLAELGPCLAQTLKDGGFRHDADGTDRTPAAELGTELEPESPVFDFKPPTINRDAFRIVPIPDPRFGAVPPRDASAASVVDDLPDADLSGLLRSLHQRHDRSP